MMGFWEKYTWPFVIISVFASVGILCCAAYIYEKNCQERLRENYPKQRMNSKVVRCGKIICAVFYRIWTVFYKSSQTYTENKVLSDNGQKRIPWSREIQPFVLVCAASIIMPNALLVAAEKVRLTVPSPLSYENTFLLIVPLAWTVGIAFFQYRIQNELIGAEERAKEAENKKKMQQQEEHRRGELISALGSLYACELTAYNFNTRNIMSSNKMNKMKHFFTARTGYAFEIANKSGTPCFYFPYYVFENGLSSNLTIKLEGMTLTENNYFIEANALKIFIPSDLNCFKNTNDNFKDNFHKKIKDFFVAPLYRKSVSEKLQFSIILHASDPFYKSNAKSTQGNGLSSINYEISFQLEPFGGYSSDGSFSMLMTEYSIE